MTGAEGERKRGLYADLPKGSPVERLEQGRKERA